MSQAIKYESTTVEPEQSAAEIMQLVRAYWRDPLRDDMGKSRPAGRDGIGPNERPPFGCCLLIWGVSDGDCRRSA